MGRRKLEMKRIEDKNSRQVTFSKRRTGLMKKARHLSVLCDVDIAVLVFSARGKLYESCSGSRSNRYERIIAEEGERTNNGADGQLEVLSQCTKFRTCKELLQKVDRLVEENNSEELSVTDMTELEQELDAALVQTRLRKCTDIFLDLEMIVKLKSAVSAVFDATMKLIQDVGQWRHASHLSRSEDVYIGVLETSFRVRDGDIGSLEPLMEAQQKLTMNKEKDPIEWILLDSSKMVGILNSDSLETQLMMEYMSTLQEEEKKLTADKEELEKQVVSAKQLQNDDGGGGLNNLANNQTNSPLHLVTLPLFNG
ncbi:K-box region and MADS-box transcription factor family protein [Tanacetum coccineum]